MTSKQTVLITGCSDGGLGSALAIVMQQRGLHVFATARDPSKMTALDRLPDVTTLKLDVVQPAHIKAAVELVSKQTGGTLNYLISNAGRNHFMPILDEDLDTVRDLFEINFYGPLSLTQAFAPLLIKAKGMAIFVTSIAGYCNVPYMGKYHKSRLLSPDETSSWRLIEQIPRNILRLQKIAGNRSRDAATGTGPLRR